MLQAHVTTNFPELGCTGWEQEATPSGEFHERLQRAGRTADEPRHCSLYPREQAGEKSPCKAFHLLPAPIWPKKSKSYLGLVPLISTLNMEKNEGETVLSCQPSIVSVQPCTLFTRHQ